MGGVVGAENEVGLVDGDDGATSVDEVRPRENVQQAHDRGERRIQDQGSGTRRLLAGQHQGGQRRGRRQGQ